ncbi:uncharacterized protein LOC121262109 [Juglans microcarpa x Juglans regia]|uniref:uncharacterized protein LOC121262109 n=1 Tax=Juglans microcarpa x Juglans regia TaxID=2249226 RepID=UPI001B7DECCA|nr:uncharacterized protein LOC121262109 [Juglans microcarpa x Juglans regia]
MVKFFLWKAANELLPTKRNLFHRKIVENPLCPICFRDEESVIHALWKCPAANDVWANGLSGIHKWKREGVDLLTLRGKMMKVLEKATLEEPAVILRKVWLRRNTFVFYNRLTCPRRLLSTAIETLEDFKKENGRVITKDQQAMVLVNKSKWVRPAADFVKVNWDASLDLKNRRMGMEIISRNEEGEALLGVCDSRMNV